MDGRLGDSVLPVKPCAIAATGISHVDGGPENLAYITAFFAGHVIGYVNLNWLSPVKVRRTMIAGSKQMIVYDDMEATEKVKVYDKGIAVTNTPEALYKILFGYRIGDMYAPHLDTTEALRTEAIHFAECIEKATTPITDGYAGPRVVRILEAATQSMKERGRLVDLGAEAVHA